MTGRPADPAAALAAVSDAVLAIAAERSLDAVLHRLVGAARRLSGARYGALGIPDGEGGFASFIHEGMSDDVIDDLGPLPRTHGLLGALLAETEPYRTDDIRADPRFEWWPAAHPRMRSFLGVPIVFKGDVVAAFYLADKDDGEPFTGDDERLISVLAAHAAIAIENTRLIEQSRELSIVEERNRVARELHDALTQTLFSLTLTSEAAASAVRTDPDRAEAELAQVRSLVDRAFADLRSLIAGMRPPDLDRDGLVETIAKQLDILGRARGIDVQMDARGEGRLPPGVEAAVFRILQEALTNAVRHSAATSIEVEVAVDGGGVRASVRDDGSGFDPDAHAVAGRRLGLTSMRERADEIGARLAIESAPGNGTTVRVEVDGG